VGVCLDRLILEADEIIDLEEYNLIDLEKIDLAVVELEKSRVKNLREKAALTVKIIDKDDTEVFYGFPPRPKFEVLGGLKIAKSRGAELDKVKIFNLYFRFKSSRLNGTSTAMMFREKPSNQEYILLLPDDTEATYEREKRFYLDMARDFVFEYKMDPNEQNRLVENLRLLNRRERCAQSLQHEWGHILHYRCFDLLPKNNKAEQLRWFYEEGYVTLLDKRYPGLGYHNSNDFLYYIKEAFVEDIRINLNFKLNGDKFILPNAVTYIGDFQDPDLLLKGVSLVENMITKLDKSGSKKPSQSTSGEINRVRLGLSIAERSRDFPVFSNTVSPELINKFIDQFEEEAVNKKHVYML
jgi:hypothetical protein